MKQYEVDCLTQGDYRALKEELKVAEVAFTKTWHNGLGRPWVSVSWPKSRKVDKGIYTRALERFWATIREGKR